MAPLSSKPNQIQEIPSTSIEGKNESNGSEVTASGVVIKIMVQHPD